MGEGDNIFTVQTVFEWHTETEGICYAFAFRSRQLEYCNAYSIVNSGELPAPAHTHDASLLCHALTCCARVLAYVRAVFMCEGGRICERNMCRSRERGRASAGASLVTPSATRSLATRPARARLTAYSRRSSTPSRVPTRERDAKLCSHERNFPTC